MQGQPVHPEAAYNMQNAATQHALSQHQQQMSSNSFFSSHH